ncbi:MAG: immunoglobulin-like domain-containing protein [Clostridia bacterium]
MHKIHLKKTILLRKGSAPLLIALLLAGTAGCGSETEIPAAQTPTAPVSAVVQTPTPIPTKAPDPTPTPVPDYDPPVLTGVVDRQFYVGEGIAYLKGVTAIDAVDGEVEVAVDRSKVDPKTPGEYEVLYTARDKAGNEVSQTAVITLSAVKITQEQLDEAADEVIAEIIKDGMTMEEKAWEIYKYVNTHVRYWDSSDKNDWRAEAYRGITEGWGDCFTYFSVSQILLTKIGAEILPVERMGGITRHYWHIVNLGGGWYHFDACIHKPPFVSFLRTDAEFEEFAAKQKPGYEYYTYDKTKYPEVSTVPFEWDRSSME